MALPLYAFTLFVSAFILFLVQPMVAKMILPRLGGTPQVWNTCMMFFQMVLLAGYAYSHTVSTRLKLKQQLLVHCSLLLVPLLILLPTPLNDWVGPFNLRSFTPTLGANPIPYTLAILLYYVGLPFLVVATTAPLLQKWFAYTGDKAAKDPYFLYGASNLGSMLALLMYPAVIEPLTAVTTQTWIWTGGYLALIGTVLACAALVWAPSALGLSMGGGGHREPTSPPAPEPTPLAADPDTGITASSPAGAKRGIRLPARAGVRHDTVESAAAAAHITDDVTPGRRLRWVLLAAVPSSLMLGVTTHITTDLSPIPFFWVLPLALYLLSFILVFARWPVVWTETPHTVMLYAQPVAIAVMVLVDIMAISHSYIVASIVFNILGFFLTTMVCHGELARDRPGVKHLTEFYLWMSVGGMLGGLFNGLVAPVLIKWRTAEYGMAIFAACLVRPRMRDTGWFDDWLNGMLEGRPAAPVQRARAGRQAVVPQPVVAEGPSPSMIYYLDVGLAGAVLLLTGLLAFGVPEWVAGLAEKFVGRSRDSYGMMITFLTYGIPLTIACFYYGRPLRFGLAIGAVMLIHFFQAERSDTSEFRTRSYFGLISVKKVGPLHRETHFKYNGRDIVVPFMQLIHGHINHGMNFIPPEAEEDFGNPEKDFSRLATTYYHRLGPAGRVMEQYNWFPGPQNTFWADVRMPASQVATATSCIGTGALPLANLVDLWSEPPFATVGLGTGTMAGYGRPYQHVHYYEIDNQIRLLSLPGANYFTFDQDLKTRPPYFTYLSSALKRGCEVEVLMGDARLRMNMPYLNYHTQTPDGSTGTGTAKIGEKGGGPENFYHMMVVDAFSSDAIPAHLITKEAIKMYFEKLAPQGILCVHTSNRFVDLPLVVGAVADDLGFAYLRGHDIAPFKDQIGQFTSEWVMVARKTDHLGRIRNLVPDDYQAAFRRERPRSEFEPYWKSVETGPRYVWTDDFTNLLAVMR